MPWGDADLLAQVQALLPEGEPVDLRDHGVTELPLAALNARLAPLGYRIHASQRWHEAKAVTCRGPNDRVRWYALFALQRLAPGAEEAASHRHGHA